MTIELDADEQALHDYQLEHFSEIMPFVLSHVVAYGALVGALLSLIFYLVSFRDPPPPDGLLSVLYYPPPLWTDVVFNCTLVIPIGAMLGCFIAAGLGFIYAKFIQMTCRKQVSKDYVEQYDFELLFLLCQIFLPIPLVILILIIEGPVLWYADIERFIGFIVISYAGIWALLRIVNHQFLKWYIPPLLPPLE